LLPRGMKLGLTRGKGRNVVSPHSHNKLKETEASVDPRLGKCRGRKEPGSRHGPTKTLAGFLSNEKKNSCFRNQRTNNRKDGWVKLERGRYSRGKELPRQQERGVRHHVPYNTKPPARRGTTFCTGTPVTQNPTTGNHRGNKEPVLN